MAAGDTKTWKNNSATLTVAAGDWDASAPGTDEIAALPVVSAGLTAGFTALGAVLLRGLTIGFDARGSIGTAANPITVGAMTALTGFIDINAPNATEIHLAPTSVPEVIVRASGNNKYAVHLKSGTYTKIKIETEGRVVIGAAAIVTSRIVVNRGYLLIEPGATLTGCDIEQNGGFIENWAAVPATIYGGGGQFLHTGDPAVAAAVVNIGTIRAMSNWLGDLRMKGAISKIAAHGGRVDFTRDSRPKTVSSEAYAFTGGLIDATGGHVAFTNQPEEMGGRIIGAANVKQIFVGGAAGGAG